MPSVTENCICGATLTYEGEAPRMAADEFRRSHAVCREAASKPTVKMPATSVQPPSVYKPSPNQCEAV